MVEKESDKVFQKSDYFVLKKLVLTSNQTNTKILQDEFKRTITYNFDLKEEKIKVPLACQYCEDPMEPDFDVNEYFFFLKDIRPLDTDASKVTKDAIMNHQAIQPQKVPLI